MVAWAIFLIGIAVIGFGVNSGNSLILGIGAVIFILSLFIRKPPFGSRP